MPPKKAKRDVNEREIIDALRHVGATVQQINETDAPDLLVGYGFDNFLIEVKTKTGKLRDGQIDWHKNWNGQVNVARTVEEALSIIGIIVS